MAFGVGIVLAIAEEVASTGCHCARSEDANVSIFADRSGRDLVVPYASKVAINRDLAVLCEFCSGSLAAKPDILFLEIG